MGAERRTDPHASFKFSPGQRLTDVIEIFALVAKNSRELVLIGDDPIVARRNTCVRRKTLVQDVHFLGKQDLSTATVSQADLFLCPRTSKSFGWPRLSHGLRSPRGCLERSAIPEVVEHGVDGYLHEPRDV